MAETNPVASANTLPPSPCTQSPPATARKARKPNSAEKRRDLSSTTPSQHQTHTKLKQTKSRTGCITCKKKRLKCDETKPTCQNCADRQVECGGYLKTYKWRCFEEQNVAFRVVPSLAGRPPQQLNADAAVEAAFAPLSHAIGAPCNQSHVENKDDSSMKDNFKQWKPAHVAGQSSTDSDDFDWPNNLYPTPPGGDDADTSDPYSFEHQMQADDWALDDLANDFVGPLDPMLEFSVLDPNLGLADGLPDAGDPSGMVFEMEDCEKLQETVDPNETYLENAVDGNNSCRDLSIMGSQRVEDVSFQLQSPTNRIHFRTDDAHILFGQYFSSTVGIMSVKDGLDENPWRTIIGQMLHDSPVVQHAILSMSCFHFSESTPHLSKVGLQHVTKAFSLLRNNMDCTPPAAAAAASLALAFSESWDLKTATGIDHIKFAKHHLNRLQEEDRSGRLSPREHETLRFLSKTWLYIDVIARLTSVDEEPLKVLDLDLAVLVDSPETCEQIDPLMGAASTLFPLIGQVANLVRKVCRVPQNSLDIISEASELEDLLENWIPPTTDRLHRPNDQTCAIQHAIHTAEAYRTATQLYLHQAVPEISSTDKIARLAARTLNNLAAVPISSRTVIVQIYPLLAAGCEAATDADRAWVSKRWQQMAQRMHISNLGKCAEVCHAVWRRRDAHASGRFVLLPDEDADDTPPAATVEDAPTGLRTVYSTRKGCADFRFSPRWMRARWPGWNGRQWVEQPEALGEAHGLDRRLSVRGRLHWVGVMKDRGWEVLLG